MNYKTISEHSFDESLLKPKGWVLDVGSRYGEFSKYFATMGFSVIAVDPNPTITKDHFSGAIFENVALVPMSLSESEVDYVLCNVDSQCNHITGVPLNADIYPNLTERGTSVVKVPAMTIFELMEKYGIDSFELAKFDCEGSEVLLLDCHPIAKQISVEFHLHMGQPQTIVDQVVNHLESIGYTRHGQNYGNILFVLGDNHG
jgi:FkbM family methyltransferase